MELVAGGALDLASSPRVSCSRKWSQKIGVKLCEGLTSDDDELRTVTCWVFVIRVVN